jgi:hypothetical protein
MRMLADNPSMDFVRREAKELLPALRETDPTATLADAQRTLAELYGFRTWSDLKAEVDRRREALPEAPPGLADEIARAFGLGDPTGPLTPIRYEYMGRRWCLQTAEGRFMVSPVFDWIDDTQAEVAVDLATRARAEGVQSPRPVRTPDGGLVRRALDQSWRVDRWMDLGPTPVRPAHSSIARKAGELLAAVHAAAPPTARPVDGPWITHRPVQGSWDALLQRAQEAGKPWADELAALSRTVEELETVRAEGPPERVVISNCDLVPEAIRLGAAHELVVVHWDFSGPMAPSWELATMLTQWAVYGTTGPNFEAARALVDGYRTRAGSAPALTVGSFHVAVTGWLNWAFNQACEAIAPASADKAEFSERALRETMADPLSVARLEALLEALEPATA